MSFEVLVATVGQSDLSLAEKMNLRRSAVVANQCDHWSYDEAQTAFGKVRMLSSATVGVGVNRNLALQMAQADILLFADDDIVYYDDLQPVIRAFEELPDADVIFFAIDMTRNGEVFDRRRHRRKRLHLWNSLKYGACRMAVRREAVLKNRLCFSTLFGGGCRYGHGEDTIFIRDCLKAGLHIYAHEHVLGACAKDSSTWFTGYDEKYFFDLGAILACAFPVAKHLYKWHFIRKLRRRTTLSLSTVLRQLRLGMRDYRSNCYASNTPAPLS